MTNERDCEEATMSSKSGWLRVSVSLVLLAVALLPACQKDTAKANKAAVTSPAELQRRAAQAKQALEGLKPQISALNTTLAELHRQYDPLPPGLPGFGETRGRFYATAEGVGMMNASVPWLSARIDSALKAGDGAELAAITQDITQKYDEARQADRITLELRHEVLPFKNKVEDFQLNGSRSCE
jgi:hypothetical protein